MLAAGHLHKEKKGEGVYVQRGHIFRSLWYVHCNCTIEPIGFPNLKVLSKFFLKASSRKLQREEMFSHVGCIT